uniref:Uncharacterized protein n=1 Tax=Compsopogon caeruleus TaxID=31354 RepID=A0A7S1TGW4_9RHOD|mmetsp:Transcript_5824/g.11516  ORF Transcript_5824/g.11516 Transcript_5824/m.11516 type:complete len:197 (+) Transcript_5824:196-786(+)
MSHWRSIHPNMSVISMDRFDSKLSTFFVPGLSIVLEGRITGSRSRQWASSGLDIMENLEGRKGSIGHSPDESSVTRNQRAPKLGNESGYIYEGAYYDHCMPLVLGSTDLAFQFKAPFVVLEALHTRMVVVGSIQPTKLFGEYDIVLLFSPVFAQVPDPQGNGCLLNSVQSVASLVGATDRASLPGFDTKRLTQETS